MLLEVQLNSSLIKFHISILKTKISTLFHYVVILRNIEIQTSIKVGQIQIQGIKSYVTILEKSHPKNKLRNSKNIEEIKICIPAKIAPFFSSLLKSRFSTLLS